MTADAGPSRLRRAAAVAVAILGAQWPALAQPPPQPESAQVGAGTTGDTTNGESQPKSKARHGEPPLPQPSLCDAYQGDARAHCLETVLREPPAPSPQPADGARGR